MPFPIAAAVGLGSGLISGLIGGGQRRKGRKMLNNLVYPTYEIPKEVMDNKSIATDMAATGMPAQQYAQAQQNIQRGQNSAIQQAQNRRAGIGLIGAIQRNSNDAQLGLDVADAKARQENKMNLMNVNSQVAGYRDKAFDWNKKNKYLQDRQYAMSLMGAGNQNIMSGIDKGLASIPLFFNKGGSGGGFLGGGSSGGGGNPNYYNGYNENSGYGDFETNY